MSDYTPIAGSKNVSNWKNLRERIRANPNDSSLWEEAYTDFLYERLRTRYFRPIELIESQGCLEGEGFSIMAIYCSLIEFLEALFEGKKFVKKNTDRNNHQYNGQDGYFKNFLITKKPFKNFFSQDHDEAECFYVDVRCGLLHEAQTNGGWRIMVKKDGDFNNFLEIYHKEKIVYRDNFGLAIQEYLKNYKTQLLESKDRQDAFIRRFNVLCDLAVDY